MRKTDPFLTSVAWLPLEPFGLEFLLTGAGTQHQNIEGEPCSEVLPSDVSQLVMQSVVDVSGSEERCWDVQDPKTGQNPESELIDLVLKTLLQQTHTQISLKRC